MSASIKRDDLHVYWALHTEAPPPQSKGESHYVLVGTVFRNDRPKTIRPGKLAVVELRMSGDIFAGEETTMEKLIEIAEQRLALDLQEINGLGMFKNEEPGEWVEQMRELLA